MNSTSCHFWLWAYGSILCMARETITTLCTYLNVNTRSFSLILHKTTRVPSYRIAWFLNSASKLQWISLLLSVNWKARPSVKENLFSIRKGGNMVSIALAHDSTGLSDAQESSSPFRGKFNPEKTSQMTCRISNVNKMYLVSSENRSKQGRSKKGAVERREWGSPEWSWEHRSERDICNHLPAVSCCPRQ